MLRRARQFFERREILEVDTPILTRFPVTDPHIASLAVGSSPHALFLHTSPEYRMKQLLAAGFGDIYQICKVFRDGERGAHHLQEFTLVEWYRQDFGLQQIMRETIEFLATLLEKPELVSTAEITSYDALFRESLDLDIRAADSSQLAASLNADRDLERAIGDDRDAWLDLVLTQRIVPRLTPDRFTVISHYPASQAALARRCPDDPACADRFEVYYGSAELANGYVELTDADEQLARFRRDQQHRRSRKLPVHEIDADFVAALRAGLPPSAGVAVGFERLLMVHEGEYDIAAVTNFISSVS